MTHKITHLLSDLIAAVVLPLAIIRYMTMYNEHGAHIVPQPETPCEDGWQARCEKWMWN